MWTPSGFSRCENCPGEPQAEAYTASPSGLFVGYMENQMEKNMENEMETRE